MADADSLTSMQWTTPEYSFMMQYVCIELLLRASVAEGEKKKITPVYRILSTVRLDAQQTSPQL